MKSSKQKVTPPSQLDRMFQVATRAPLSLSTSNLELADQMAELGGGWANAFGVEGG